MNKITQLLILLLIAFTGSLKAQEHVESARKELLFENDTLYMERDEVRYPLMVEAGKRMNYKHGVYILQSDLGMLKNYGYHKTPAQDALLVAKMREIAGKGKAVDIGSFPYTLFTADIKYYYLGKFKIPVPTGYYKDNGEKRRAQGYTRMFVPVYVVTDINAVQ